MALAAAEKVIAVRNMAESTRGLSSFQKAMAAEKVIFALVEVVELQQQEIEQLKRGNHV